MSNCPMAVGFENDIRIVALSDGFHRFYDDCGIAQVEQAAVTILGIDDRPLVNVCDFSVMEPDEASESLPVVSRLFCRLFEIEGAEDFLVPG